jgi:hypothetical protein
LFLSQVEATWDEIVQFCPKEAVDMYTNCLEDATLKSETEFLLYMFKNLVNWEKVVFDYTPLRVIKKQLIFGSQKI